MALLSLPFMIWGFVILYRSRVAERTPGANTEGTTESIDTADRQGETTAKVEHMTPAAMPTAVRSDPASLKTSPSNAELADGSEVKESAAEESLGGLRKVFWIVPLYALFVGFIAVSYAWTQPNWLLWILKHPPTYKVFVPAGAIFFVGLLGVSVRSIECARLLRRDPFRAFAMGRFILLLYLLIGFPIHALLEWPPGPLSWQWLEGMVGLAKELVSTWALVEFAFATYRILLAQNSEYLLPHFVFDITFGWKGEKYG